MNFGSLWFLSLALSASAWLAWGLARRRSASVRGKRWWRVGSAIMGLLAILAASGAFLQLGLSADFERAFADEDFPRAALGERLAQIDRLMAIAVFAGVAGGVAIVLAVSDAARE